MSKLNQASEGAVFALAVLIVLFLGSWYSICLLGHSEGAIGSDFDNLKISAVFLVPVVALSAMGYWLSGLLSNSALSRTGVIARAVVSGALIFAWPLFVPLLPTPLNIVGFGAYC